MSTRSVHDPRTREPVHKPEAEASAAGQPSPPPAAAARPAEPARLDQPRAPQIEVVPPVLPKGGGAIKGLGERLELDEATGAASLTIPFPATPCRGAEPRLHVTYSSAGGNGAFGLGFGLSLPDVSRRTSKEIPRYRDDDIFLLSGEPLVRALDVPDRVEDFLGIAYTVTAFRPRIESAFDRIERWQGAEPGDAFWKVFSRDNVASLFGRTPQARVTDPGDPSRIFRWLLEETWDAHGNRVQYLYKAEDGANVPSEPSEENRDRSAQKYLSRIRYGNAKPVFGALTPPESLLWHFEVVLDYGEYAIDPEKADNYSPVQAWSCRRDPFSFYDAGFEIRTRRLCRNVLMFHRFPEELGVQPVLVRVLALSYDESPALTLLRRVTLTGFQYQPNQAVPYTVRSMPPLDLHYTPFQPAGHGYGTFLEPDGRSLPGVSVPSAYSLVDLYGDGVPGVLYCDGTTLRYWAAERPPEPGDAARYAAAEEVVSFPLDRRIDGATHALVDLTGDGRLDLLVTDPPRVGFYGGGPDGSWSDFRPLEFFPLEYHDPFTRQVDVTGDGLADLVRVETARVRVHPALPGRGFGDPELQVQEATLPILRPDWPRESVRFADLAGAGKPQLVRIADGEVTYWPSLGHGRFGPPVRMANAPRLGPDFDAGRVFLADLDGTGAADLIYASSDRVDVYFNESGNRFRQTPLRLPLPERWDDLSQLQFADVLGNGTACLVFAKPHPAPRHWYYDFCQRRKPYLLERIDNNLGAVTIVRHVSATEQYLEDKRVGRPWITRPPFPVQVVAEVEHQDLISRSRHNSSYRYRHGFYDGDEREFAGFGRVDRVDTEEVETLGPRPGAPRGEAPWPSPPTLTRTWHHTGAWWPGLDLLELYRAEHYAGDCQASPPRRPVLDFGTGPPPDPETLREAHRALRGTVLRTEVFGLDGSPWSGDPYAVTETATRVRLLQPRADNRYAVFAVRPLETLHYDYERNPADPRVVHEAVLETDSYDHVLRSCQLAYPRRADGGGDASGQQTTLRAVCQDTAYIHAMSADCHLLGAFEQTRRTELTGFAPDHGLYFGLAELREQVAEALASGRRLSWERAYYYHPGTEKELPLGKITPEALPSRTEQAELHRQGLAHAFEGVLTPGELAERLTRVGPTGGGYRAYPDDPDPEAKGYFWNPGSAQVYLGADRFFLPHRVTDPFGSANRTEHDPHGLLVRKTTDALGNATTAREIDYRTLAARRIEDLNGNLSEALLDPLGMVTVTSYHGTEGGAAVGFASLADYQPQPAPPSSSAVLKDPGKYLQQAASFFHADLDAWVRDGTPVHVVELVAEGYPGEEAPIQVRLLHGDGFGRELESKLKVREAGPALSWREGRIAEVEAAERWLTSGAVRYNRAGDPVQSFEPFFSDTPHYVDSSELNEHGVSSTLHYDALGRRVLVVTPKTFLVRTLHGEEGPVFLPGPWTELHFDENRTVEESAYYQGVLEGTIPAPKFEKESLQKAASFHGTPVRYVLDNLGRTIRVEQRLIPAPTADPALIGTYADLDVDGNALALADTRLQALGKKNLETVYTLAGQTLKTVSVDAGTRWHLQDALGKPIFRFDTRGFTTTHHYDPLRRPIALHVEGGDGEPKLNQLIERLVYGDSEGCFTDPKKWNLRGQLVAHLDSAGLALSSHFTLRAEPLATARVLGNNYKEEAKWDSIDGAVVKQLATSIEAVPQPAELKSVKIPGPLKPFLEGETFVARTAYDALGRPCEETDPDNNVTRRRYCSTGQLESARVASSRHPVTPSVDRITYDAKGQRDKVLYGNGVEIKYRYERETFRLARLTATRPSGAAGPEVIQDLEYYYDPAGNVTHITDHAIPPVFCNGQKVDPESDYTYDSLYRLIRATGREHPGMWPREPRGSVVSLSSLSGSSLNDQQKLQNYVQTFTYDAGGNLTRIKHQASESSACWTRANTIAEGSNRLVRSEIGGCGKRPSGCHDYTYDSNGNQTTLDNISELRWSCRDHLQSVALIIHEEGIPDAEYYVYDSAGRRVQKVTERLGHVGAALHLTEIIYLVALEIHRKRTPARMRRVNIYDQWHTFSLIDLDRRIGIWCYSALVMVHTRGSDVRYQMHDHLGSSVWELDHEAQLIARELYYPHGGAAYVARDIRGAASSRRYRYSGKEKDAVTGAYYYGTRYYCTWLGRWLSTDAEGMVDGTNLYAFVRNNPITLIDRFGCSGESQSNPFTPMNDTWAEGSGANLRSYTWYRKIDKEWSKQVTQGINTNQFRGLTTEGIVQGWKLHVSADVADLERVKSISAESLKSFQGVRAKYVISEKVYASVSQDHTNYGKAVVVYPRNVEELVDIAQKLDKQLSQAKLNPAPKIKHEIALGSSGLLFTRYGGFFGTKLVARDKLVLNLKKMTTEFDLRAGGAYPNWVEKPKEFAELEKQAQARDNTPVKARRRRGAILERKPPA